MLPTDEEKRMQTGEYGPGIKMSMDLLIKLGDSFDAEKLVPISYGCISYDFTNEDFWDLMIEGVPKTTHRVTTHASYSPELWKEWGLTLADKRSFYLKIRFR